MSILHLLADLEDPFLKYFLNFLDTDGYYTSIKCVDRFQGFSCSLTNRYLHSLGENEFGNINFKVRKNDSDLLTNQNYAHRPRRGDGMSKVEKICNDAQDLKRSVTQNIVDNILQQSRVGTIVEFASAFDMNRPIDLSERIELLKELHNIYWGLENVSSVVGAARLGWGQAKILGGGGGGGPCVIFFTHPSTAPKSHKMEEKSNHPILFLLY